MKPTGKSLILLVLFATLAPQSFAQTNLLTCTVTYHRISGSAVGVHELGPVIVHEQSTELSVGFRYEPAKGSPDYLSRRTLGVKPALIGKDLTLRLQYSEPLAIKGDDAPTILIQTTQSGSSDPNRISGQVSVKLHKSNSSSYSESTYDVICAR